MKKCHAVALSTYSFAVFGWAATNVGVLPYPTIKQHGNILQSVCGPTELQGLKAQFAQYMYKDGTKAWKAVTILLCGSKTDENTRYIRKLMAAKLVSTSDYTGQDNQPEATNASNETAANLFALGIAYDAGVYQILCKRVFV